MPRVMHTFLLLTLPALAVAIGFGTLFGYRFDYLGHYAAGFGGSLGVMVLGAALIADAWFSRAAPWAVVGLCLVCIGLGVGTEATVFNIAKFDEVDFFNQSLGAALAGAATLAWIRLGKPTPASIGVGLLTAMAFLGAGFYFALFQ